MCIRDRLYRSCWVLVGNNWVVFITRHFLHEGAVCFFVFLNFIWLSLGQGKHLRRLYPPTFNFLRFFSSSCKAYKVKCFVMQKFDFPLSSFTFLSLFLSSLPSEIRLQHAGGKSMNMLLLSLWGYGLMLSANLLHGIVKWKLTFAFHLPPCLLLGDVKKESRRTSDCRKIWFFNSWTHTTQQLNEFKSSHFQEQQWIFFSSQTRFRLNLSWHVSMKIYEKELELKKMRGIKGERWKGFNFVSFMLNPFFLLHAMPYSECDDDSMTKKT